VLAVLHHRLLGNQKIIHNDFAEILMGCGVIGFSIYVVFLTRVFALLLGAIKGSMTLQRRYYGTLAMSAYVILLAFHMTNVTSGVLILSIWSIFTGTVIGNAKVAEQSSPRALSGSGQQTRQQA
jgi:O-antigen ligase